MGGTINLKNLSVVLVFLVASTCSIAAGRVIYVDDYGPPHGDGLSWLTAFRYLQEALTIAQPEDEIRVAQGIYCPDEIFVDPNGTDDRNASFQLRNNVTIKGGYAGCGKPDPNVRNVNLYKSVLSGDLAKDDVGGLDDPSRNENSLHILTGDNTNSSAILDGFTITAGSPGMDPMLPSPYGGGILIFYGSPTITNCTFTAHSGYAGAVCFLGECSPRLTNCTFMGNSAVVGGALVGSEVTFTLTNCTFIGNSGDLGGAFYNEAGSATLTRCVFKSNTSSVAGGAILFFLSSSWFHNCLFTGNSCSQYGGAMYYWYGATPRVHNCTFADNSALDGNAIACDDLDIIEPPLSCNVSATNCIFRDGGSEIYNGNDSVITITYSDVQGGWLGTGNIDTDPCFTDSEYGDYHLISQAGRWNPDSESWVHDSNTSPCVDAGDPGSDWSSELWPHGKHINMGAYGGTPEASMSLSDVGSITDMDFDGGVGFRDVRLLIDKWLYEVILLPEDLSRDGIVNFVDVSMLAKDWGIPCLASNPDPFDGEGGVSTTSDLSWTAGCNAASHDVYFGTTNPPPFVCNQAETIFDTGTMTPDMTYYWRIDEINSMGTTPGPVWSFTTMMSPPP